MKIETPAELLLEIQGRNAPRRCETGPQPVRVPVLKYTLADWPAESDIDALLLMADLQYVDRTDLPPEHRRLLGEAVANELAELAAAGLLPDADKTGVVIAGDMYTRPDLGQRGTTGDVDRVWIAFAERFRWVTGVAGNHDLFDGQDRFHGRVARQPNSHPLEAEVVELGGFRIAGFSGIPGNPRKPWRYTDKEAEDAIPNLLSVEPDLLVLHAGPASEQHRLRGSHHIAELIALAPPPLVVMGHCHWPEPLVSDLGTQLMNIDSRIVYLTR